MPVGTVVWTLELAGNCPPFDSKRVAVGAYSAGMTGLATSQRLPLILAR
jgi:hypothetical protein